MKIALTGASGMLGSSFADLLGAESITPIERDLLQAPTTDALRARIRDCRLLVNCAADTDVEGAEDSPDAAFRANAAIPSRLARLCREEGVVLMHWSSTGCYGDWKDEPYTEEDALSPGSIHHRSKAFGEREVRESGCEHLIFRTGWLYGGPPAGRKNFVWKRLLEARQHTFISSDSVQRGNPTFAPDAARQALAVYHAGIRGTSNLTAHGAATRFDYVARIIGRSQMPCTVEPGPAFKRRARVSHNEVGRNMRLQLLDADEMRDWEEPLDRYVDALIASPEWQSLE